ncbi:MAG: hypothetical protein WA143_10540 [Lutibacter sp.]
MNRKKVSKILLSFSFMLICVTAYAQTPPPPVGEPDPELPIDGGLSLLLASGVAYGIYSLKRKK